MNLHYDCASSVFASYLKCQLPLVLMTKKVIMEDSINLFKNCFTDNDSNKQMPCMNSIMSMPVPN